MKDVGSQIQDVQIATGPLHQAVESLVPALLIGARYLGIAQSGSVWLSLVVQLSLGATLRAEASFHQDGTMLCNASTGDGGGACIYVMTQFFIWSCR